MLRGSLKVLPHVWRLQRPLGGRLLAGRTSPLPFSVLNSLTKNFHRQYTNGYRPNHKVYTYRSFDNGTNRKNKTLVGYVADPANRKYLLYLLAGGTLFYVANLKEAPVSGRKRFICVPPKLELAIGKYSYRSILQETRGAVLPENHPLTRKVERIFARIVEAAQRDPTVDKTLLEGIEWKIHVVNDPSAPPNAFVLPGGKVFVFSNILSICQNDDGIATVLSHEFAHQLARHTSENLSKAPIYSIVSLVLYSLTGIQGINDLLTDGLLRMPASRQMETEADYIGLMMMARACFNPNESVKLWERMAEFEKRTMQRGANFEFLSTHPASEHRIQNMTGWLGKANTIYEQSECSAFGGIYKEFQDVFGGSILPIKTASSNGSPPWGF